jgi:biotin carboxyl carrier protein
MEYLITIDDETKAVSIRRHHEEGWWIQVEDGPERHLTGTQLASSEWLLREGGRQGYVGAGVDGDKVRMQIGGYPILAKVVDSRSYANLAGGGSEAAGRMETPIPGAVVRVMVEEGQRVASGSVLLVIEAMKMENEFKAPFDGLIESIHVTAGDTVVGGQLLIVVTPEAN